MRTQHTLEPVRVIHTHLYAQDLNAPHTHNCTTPHTHAHLLVGLPQKHEQEVLKGPFAIILMVLHNCTINFPPIDLGPGLKCVNICDGLHHHYKGLVALHRTALELQRSNAIALFRYDWHSNCILHDLSHARYGRGH